MALLEPALTRLAAESGMHIGTSREHAVLLRATGDTAFKWRSAALSPRFATFVKRLADVLQASPGLTVEITGHSDNVGSAPRNELMSVARAKAVVDALVKYGVPAACLTAQGLGAREPVAGNETSAGRAANRRVDLLIAEPAS